MIVVRVELWSAVTGKVSELARMHLSNAEAASTFNPRLGTYLGESFVGRDSATLDRQRVSKRGTVEKWRRFVFHVWNLVARMLADMGYTK